MAYRDVQYPYAGFLWKNKQEKKTMFPTPAKFSFLSGLFPALPFSLLDMVLLAGILWLVAKR